MGVFRSIFPSRICFSDTNNITYFNANESGCFLINNFQLHKLSKQITFARFSFVFILIVLGEVHLISCLKKAYAILIIAKDMLCNS